MEIVKVITCTNRKCRAVYSNQEVEKILLAGTGYVTFNCPRCGVIQLRNEKDVLPQVEGTP
jgi:predicted RNA-binding Zn-ribbon protein involved in translation (DUF1610 family)